MSLENDSFKWKPKIILETSVTNWIMICSIDVQVRLYVRWRRAERLTAIGETGGAN